MNVQQSMDAYRDGTFEQKVKANAERRKSTKEGAATGGVRKGRDLYESMYPTTKKEQ
ncbi:UNVERIFIED_ORG: hypothetical protein J2X79_000560 [Arthrobacter globiformis]|nr:hypothetical protein [Arthrobacter globiformis]